MIEIPKSNNDWRTRPKVRPCKEWTILLLTPPVFLDQRECLPLSMDSNIHSAAIELISQCFRKLLERWKGLHDHLEELLDDRDTLTNPAKHDKLLWDDEVFTRSRKYFWAIHSLTEFHLSISDNILQWENYHAAKIEPLHKVNLLNPVDLSRLRDLDSACIALKNLRSYF
jgi:hypothetical protein